MNELDAAIKRATYGRTVSKFSNKPSSAAMRMDPRPPTITYPKVIDIKRAVADYFSIEVHDLDCNCRHMNVVKPRHFAMYLCRKLTLHSAPEIGRRFGGRDHSTVLYAAERISKLLAGDRDYNEEARQQIEAIKVLVGMQNGKTKQTESA